MKLLGPWTTGSELRDCPNCTFTGIEQLARRRSNQKKSGKSSADNGTRYRSFLRSGERTAEQSLSSAAMTSSEILAQHPRSDVLCLTEISATESVFARLFGVLLIVL